MNCNAYLDLKQALVRKFTTVRGSLAVLYKRNTGEVLGRLACGVVSNQNIIPETGKLWSSAGELLLEASLGDPKLRELMTDLDVCLCEVTTARKLGGNKKGEALYVNKGWCAKCKLGRKCPATRMKEVDLDAE